MRLPDAIVTALRALRRHPFRVATATCVVMVAGFAAAEPAWTKHQLALSFNPQPALYSEIFFSNPAAVPGHLVAGVPANVPFAIVNREGHTVTFTYSVVVTAPGIRQVAEQHQVVIGNNEKAVLIATFEPKKPDVLYAIRILLAKPAEFIEFHGRTA